MLEHGVLFGSVSIGILLGQLLLQNPALAHSEEEAAQDAASEERGVLTERLEQERESVSNPYVISTHKPNYALPISYTSSLNTELYDLFSEDFGDAFNQEEVKFQLSLKVQINKNNLLFNNDALFLGFTLKSFWQLYSKDVSSPFRETNYQPEVFYVIPLNWRPFGTTTTTVFGLEHQSNGQIQGFSRSWNRLYTGLLVEKGNLFGLLRPWYRLPEEEKETPNSPKGDDNPDILDFMGHAELVLGLRTTRFEFSANLRRNFSTRNGATELSMSFPFAGRFRGMVQYFNGYGDSLIDYDHFQQRVGIGILLNNLF